MKIIDPMVEVENYDGLKIMKNIERACRTCYRSEGNITDTSYKNLLKNCINRGHESVLEHEKITVRLTCDIGVYKDLTRHRTGTAFSIESTRYCNYSQNRFDNGIKFIKPIFYVDSWSDRNYEGSSMNEEETKSMLWYECMDSIEDTYLKMSELNCKPDELRMILPHSTAAQVTMTCNMREWRHIMSLRASVYSHPAIQQLLIPLLLKFKKDMPEIFDTIEYNTNFPSDKYATIKTMEV